MRLGSLFVGIGGFDIAAQRNGIIVAWASEIDKFARAIYRGHFPETELYGDIRELSKLPKVDIITGGFPCQDLSIAGKRKGLKGERSILFFDIIRLVKEIRPQWVLLENVPGLLSSNSGRDFAVVQSALAECGYNVAWRVLNSQYYGVPQRRRRVFIIGSLGNFGCAEVLFERESVRGDFKPRSETGPGIARTITGGATGGSGHRKQSGSDNQTLIPDISYALRANPSRSGDKGDGGVNTTLIPELAGPLMGRDAKGPLPDRALGTVVVDWQSGGDVRLGINEERTSPLQACQVPAVAYNIQTNDGGEHRRSDRPEGGLYVNETETALTVGSTDKTVAVSPLGEAEPGEPPVWLNKQQSGEIREYDGVVPPLAQYAGTGGNNVLNVGVRRLTPVECERLQGFPDDWTRYGITEAGADIEISDSARYRTLGNAVTVNVVERILKRLVDYDTAK